MYSAATRKPRPYAWLGPAHHVPVQLSGWVLPLVVELLPREHGTHSGFGSVMLPPADQVPGLQAWHELPPNPGLQVSVGGVHACSSHRQVSRELRIDCERCAE